MSRIGKKIRPIPAGVSADLKDDVLIVKGPKGTLSIKVHPSVTVFIKDGQVGVTVADDNEKQQRALWGTFSSLIGNMLLGAQSGFKKQLEINGVGFKAALQGKDLKLEVGLTNPVVITAPAGIVFNVEKNVITVEGADKELVGRIAAQIRAVKKPEPYKGKGIKYLDEIIRRKAGKTAAKTAA